MACQELCNIPSEESCKKFFTPVCNMCNRQEKSVTFCVNCNYYMCNFCNLSHSIMLCFHSHRIIHLEAIENIEDMERLFQATEKQLNEEAQESIALQLWDGKETIDQSLKLIYDLSEAFENLEKKHNFFQHNYNIHQEFQTKLKDYRNQLIALLDKECLFIRNGLKVPSNNSAVKNLINILNTLKQKFNIDNVNEVRNGAAACIVENGVTPKNLPTESLNIPLALESGISKRFVNPTPSLSTSSESGCVTNRVKTLHIYKTFGQKGNSSTCFNSPHGFCIGLNEDIVVADSSNHRVQIFDKTGIFKSQFGITGRHDGYLWYPRKIAALPRQKRYVVCDRGYERSRMQIFTETGNFIKKIYIQYIDIVAGIAVTANEDIVVVNSVTPTVFIIGQNDFLRSIDCTPFMQEPSDIAVSGKEFYICDFKAHCIVVIDEEGNLLRKFGNKYTTMFPNGIDIICSKYILVGDSHGNFFHVVVFLKDGTYVAEYRCPYIRVSRCCGLKVASDGRIVTVDKNYHHVIMLEPVMITDKK